MRNYWSITLRCSIILAVASALVWLAVSSPFRQRANAALLTPSTTQYRDALMRSGLGPEQLTAAGLSAVDIQTALSDAWDYLLANENALENADAAIASAEADYWPLEDMVRTAQATSQQFTDFQSARTAYLSALSNRDAVLDAIFNAGITDLAVAQQQSLTSMQQSWDWSMPWEFHVISRAESAWVTLREALAAERYANKHSESVDSGAASVLAGERSNFDVALASTNLATNLATNTASWNQIVDPQ